ncbi:MAG: DUF177 domain-containing protein [Candidatus Neomarinimicrobiota bacterium]
MKLYRSDLTVGIEDSLFEIPVDDLKIEDIRFGEPIFRCRLSSEVTLAGFKLTGNINIVTIETCDRCLADFTRDHDIPVNLWLTPKQDLVTESDEDLILFADKQEWIDISEPIRDLVYLDEPFKKLCRSDCLGLCPYCGQNLNEKTCGCSDSADNNLWNDLKELVE